MGTSLKSQQYVALTGLCVLAWGITLLNYDGIYWDDWIISGNTGNNIRTIFDHAGSIFSGTIHQYLTRTGNGVWIYRLISFGSSWITGLIIFRLLLGLAHVSTVDAFYISALSIVYPVNQARIAIVNTPSTYSLAVFFLAFSLLAVALRAKSVSIRVLSLGLFFFSFEVGSLLTFYLLPLVYILHQEREEWSGKKGQIDNIRRLGGWVVRRLDIICLPIVFFILKAKHFSPDGYLEGHNTVTLGGLVTGSWMSLWSMYEASVTVIDAAVASLSAAIVPLVGVLAFYLSKIGIVERQTNRDRRGFYLGMLATGLLVLYLAVFPYAVVGKIGDFSDWNSRHQLLTPLGASISLYALLRLLMGRAGSWHVGLAMSTVLMIFAHKDIVDMAQYQVDWAKQQSIIEQVRQIEKVRDNPGKTFLFVDNATEYNVGQRVYRFYEASGFLRSAFNDNSRLAVLESNASSVKGLGEVVLRQFNIEAQGKDEVVGRITIQSGERTDNQAVGIYFYRLFDTEKYRSKVLRLVTVHYSPIVEGW